MSHRLVPARQQGRLAFLIVTSLALAAAVAQISLGGIVRITDSGLGCPDWPLCHGKLFPPMELHTLIEYSHRLSAVLLGTLVLASAIMAWRSYRADSRVTGSTTLALALVGVAAVLGGITVRTELDSWAVLVHLGLAEMVAACVVVALVSSWRGEGPRADLQGGDARSEGMDLLVLGTVAGTFGLILSGSYMVGQGYGSSCSTWPLCRGSVLPEGDPYLVHMAHRIVAGIVGLMVLAMGVWAWVRGFGRRVRWASLAAVALLALQVAIGAATVWSGFPMALRAVHLGVATLLWTSVVSVAALHYVSGRLELGRVEVAAAPMSRMEGVAT